MCAGLGSDEDPRPARSRRQRIREMIRLLGSALQATYYALRAWREL